MPLLERIHGGCARKRNFLLSGGVPSAEEQVEGGLLLRDVFHGRLSAPAGDSLFGAGDESGFDHRKFQVSMFHVYGVNFGAKWQFPKAYTSLLLHVITRDTQ